MAAPTAREVLLKPIFDNNPIGLQILGICSALGSYHANGYGRGHEYRRDIGDGLLKCRGEPDSPPYSQQHPDYCANGGYRFAGDRCRPNA